MWSISTAFSFEGQVSQQRDLGLWLDSSFLYSTIDSQLLCWNKWNYFAGWLSSWKHNSLVMCKFSCFLFFFFFLSHCPKKLWTLSANQSESPSEASGLNICWQRKRFASLLTSSKHCVCEGCDDKKTPFPLGTAKGRYVLRLSWHHSFC